MFLRILKKDLKRKKTMNIILVLFIILAAMFVSSGLNNVITVSNGTDYYLDQAGVGDYIVITMGENAVGSLDDMLANTPEIKSYRMEDGGIGARLEVSRDGGEKVVTNSMLLFQDYDQEGINYYGADNEILPNLSSGHCYVTGSFLENNDMEPGDHLYLEGYDIKLDLIIDGKAKDALLGSDFMGNTRILLSTDDMNKFTSIEEFTRYDMGQVCYIDTDDVAAVAAAVNKCENVNFSEPRSTIKMAYVMDLIVAFITLILSVCLMIVSFVVLKFTITFTITEEFREIGVMKAIGISNFKIRSLYLGKYLMMAIAGGVIGLVASFPFGNLLIKSVSDNMVLGNNLGIIPNIVGAIIVIITIMLFAYISTGKVKTATPIDAIRNGQTGERYAKKSRLKLKSSKANAPSFMALNDVLSSPKRYLTIIIGFALCTLFVLILVNTVNTMKSDRLLGTFSSRADIYVDNQSLSLRNMTRTRDEMMEFINDTEADLADMGMPCRAFLDYQYQYPVFYDGQEYAIRIQQGCNTTMDSYDYMEGTVPQNKYEIAISPVVSEITGAQIGDTITIDYGTEKIDCTVVAYFDTMNNLGKIIRVHEDAPTDVSAVSGAWQFQISFTDDPTEDEIIARKDKIREYLDVYDDEVLTATEYQIECLAVTDTMETVQNLLLAITLVVVLLVTILMERSFISDEKGEIAILKAVGFRDGRVILWQVLRFGIVALIAGIIAAVLSIPMTYLCITPIFGLMGATQIDFVIEPLKIFLVYPGIIVVMTVVVTFFTALYTKTIKACDTASIE